MDKQLKGKVALVTGGTSGIGKAIAEIFIENGATVVVASSRQESIDKAKAELGCDGFAVDLSNDDDGKKLIDYIDEKYGRIDILVNNAGIQHIQQITDFDSDKWDFMMRLMLYAPFFLMKHSAPYMMKNGWGRIINMSSIQGLVASKYKSCYVVAKHGLNGLTMAGALELGEYGITVNSVCPAYVDTPLVRNQIAGQARENNISEDEVIEKIMLTNAAIKKLINPRDVAETVLFLCSDSAKMITGTSIPVDAGWTAS